MNWIIVDVATAPIEGAADYIEIPVPDVPGNYKKPETIAEWIAEERPRLILQAKQHALSKAALDMDLARITGIGTLTEDGERIDLCRSEADEVAALERLAAELKHDPHRVRQIVTYNGFAFDLPVLMRRARYLGVKFPAINLDRYKSPHLDLCEILSDRNPQRRRPLGFYAKRLGWIDITKPLSGAEEAKVHETGDWAALEASLEHDLTASYRLACWLGVVAPVREEVAL